MESHQEWVRVAKEAYKAKEQRKIWEKKEQELLAMLKTLSHNESASYDQFSFIKIIQKGKINYSSIPHLRDIPLDIYRGKDIEMWKLELRMANE